jgi:hypothetical protein
MPKLSCASFPSIDNKLNTVDFGPRPLRLAIMQPYFFPYVGYFQLIKSVDHFIFLDNVNFIKKGWINRNQFLVSGAPHLFTIALKNVSQNALISDTMIYNKESSRADLINLIDRNYGAAEFKHIGIELVEQSFSSLSGNTICELAARTVCTASKMLGLNTSFSFASDYDCDGATGARRILALCEHLSATHYVNLPGGKDLYCERDFQQRKIELQFLDVTLREYPVATFDWIPRLSVLDLIMNNGAQSKNYI